MQDYPRVLIVGGPVGAPTGTGITLAQLFGQWPPERLLQVYLDQPPVSYSSSATSNSFHLGSECAPLDYLVRKFVRRPGSRLLTGAPDNPAVSLAKDKRHSLNSMLHEQARAIADLSPVHLPRSLRSWIRQHKPDVIYSLLGSVRMIRLAKGAARCAKCPIVPHFMDDWPHTMYRQGQILGLARRVLVRELDATLAKAPVGLCISKAMAEEYSRRYKRLFIDFMNCVEDSWFVDSPALQAVASSADLRIVYCGGLHLGRSEVLALLAVAVERNRSSGQKVTLAVFAPPFDVQNRATSLTGRAGVKLGSLRPEAVADELKKADILVHVESFEAANTAYTHYSISTKIPQYLACGRPVLGIGPGALASMRHLEQSQGAVVVTENSVEAVAAGLAQLQNEETRTSLAIRGRAFSQANHSATAVREALRRVFVEALAQ